MRRPFATREHQAVDSLVEFLSDVDIFVSDSVILKDSVTTVSRSSSRKDVDSAA